MQVANWDYPSWPTENWTQAPVIALSYTSPAFAYVGILDTPVDFSPLRLDGDSMELPHSPSSPFSQPSATHTTFTQLTQVSVNLLDTTSMWFSVWSKRCVLPTLSKHELTCALSSTLPGNCSKRQERCSLSDVILQVEQMLRQWYRGQYSEREVFNTDNKHFSIFLYWIQVYQAECNCLLLFEKTERKVLGTQIEILNRELHLQ